MLIHAYGRFENGEDERAFQDAVYAKFPATVREKIKFHRDGIAGQRGLSAVLHSAEDPDTQIVVFRQFSDAGRDIGSAIRNIVAMISKVEVWILNSGVVISRAQSPQNHNDGESARL